MNQLDQIDITIEAAKENIALKKALERLTKNKDFQIVIDTGYLINEAVRYVHLKADYNMLAEDQQAYCIRGIDAIGTLRAYFTKIMQQGTAAIAALDEHENTREALLAEELVEGTVQ